MNRSLEQNVMSTEFSELKIVPIKSLVTLTSDEIPRVLDALSEGHLLLYRKEYLYLFLQVSRDIFKMCLEVRRSRRITWKEKFRWLRMIELCFQNIKPSLVAECSCFVHLDGTSTRSVVQELITTLEPQNLTIQDFVQVVDNLSAVCNPCRPTKYHVRVLFHNILTHLKEMEHVMERTTGKNYVTDEGVLSVNPFNATGDFYVKFDSDETLGCVVNIKRYKNIETLNTSGTLNQWPTAMITYESKQLDLGEISTNPSTEGHNRAKWMEVVALTECSATDPKPECVSIGCHASKRVKHVTSAMKDFVFSISRSNTIALSKTDPLFERMLRNLDGYAHLIDNISLLEILKDNSSDDFKDCILELLLATKQINAIDCSSLIAKKAKKILSTITQIITIAMIELEGREFMLNKQLVASFTKKKERPQVKSIEDAITISCKEDWRKKFDAMRNMQAVLELCPHDKCCVCYADLRRKIAKSEDLVVLPRCPHVCCMRCIKKCIRNRSVAEIY